MFRVFLGQDTSKKKPRHRSGAEKSHQVARQAGGPARPYTESRLRARRVAVVKACRVRDHVDSVVWWAHQDSNLGRTGYEPVALPLSYGPHIGRLLTPSQLLSRLGSYASF